MASLNVSMPDDLRQFVDKRTKDGQFSTPTEYVRHLIREDQKRQAESRLERLLLEALHSGDFEEVSPDLFGRLRSLIKKRAPGKRRQA
jgi:antitoxin ParD1/3/4